MRDLDGRRDLATLALPEVGQLISTGEDWEPYRLLDSDGAAVVPVAEYFAELQAADSSPLTVRSYGNDLLRWWRFLHCTKQGDTPSHGAIQVCGRWVTG